jgi:hypothetical protein
MIKLIDEIMEYLQILLFFPCCRAKIVHHQILLVSYIYFVE